MDWSHVIREFRRSRLLKQDALARDIGVDRSRISRWERGEEIPSQAAQKKLRALMSATPFGVDQRLKLLVETTPHLMQLMLPCTQVVAASQGFAEFAKATLKDIVGYYDIFDMSEKLVGQFEVQGQGVQHAHQNALRIDSYDLWMPNGFTNKVGPLKIHSSATRILLDDGTAIVCASTRILQPEEDLQALRIEWA